MKNASLPYLTKKVSRGRTYWYFRRGGTYARLPDPSDPTFLAVYDSLRMGRTISPVTTARTWTKLIESYKKSPAWGQRQARTRKDYERVFDWIIRVIGNTDPTKYEQPDIIRIQEAQAYRRRFANYIVQVIGVLFKRAQAIGWMKSNPAAGVALIQKPKHEDDLHGPWPRDAQEAFTAAAPAGSNGRTAFELELGLSQRTGDTVRLMFEDWDGTGFTIRQSKTGTALYLPATERLAAYIDSLGRTTGPLLPNPRTGKPLTYSGGYQAIRRVLKSIRRTDLTPHGLRYTVAAEVAELGGTDDEIMALTGHKSKGMAMKYAGAARQKAHATRAQGLREPKKKPPERTETES